MDYESILTPLLVVVKDTFFEIVKILLPYALAIFGVELVVKLGIKFFRSIANGGEPELVYSDWLADEFDVTDAYDEYYSIANGGYIDDYDYEDYSEYMHDNGNN